MVDSVHREEARELKAILFADVAGYTRLMQEDEVGTHKAINAITSLFRQSCDTYRGEILELRGDGMFALFSSVSDSISFALKIQTEIEDFNQGRSKSRKVLFRIGIHTGDIVREGSMYYGDAVNIAARIEGAATPGQVCISALAYEHVKHSGQFGFQNMGFQRLKHVKTPLEVYRVTADATSASRQASRRLPFNEMPFTVESEDLSARPSVAILPLKNLNRDAEFDYFVDGVTEDIITNLYRFQNLFVIARGSSFAFKNKELSSRQVGRDLNVRYLADGSARTIGNRTRITIQLIDTHKDQILWAEQFDRSLDDIFAVQDEIAGIIANAISVEITNEEHARAARVLPNDLSAYHSLLRGQQHLYQYTREGLRLAKECYENSHDQDPRYGRALASMAYAMNFEWLFSWSENSDTALDQALATANEAVSLDPNDARAHSSVALIHLYKKQHELSIANYDRALSINPNDADIIADLGDCYCHTSEFDKAVEQFKRAMELNPYYPDTYLWNLGGTYYAMSNYRMAIDTVEKMNNQSSAIRILAASYGQLGKKSTAQFYAKKVLELQPNFTLDSWLEVMPDKNPEDGIHFIEGLRKAGLH